MVGTRPSSRRALGVALSPPEGFIRWIRVNHSQAENKTLHGELVPGDDRERDG